MARNILVVEDDRNISDLIRMYLEKEGFDVRIAYDGGKAVEEFDKQAPDMVLLDIMLPVMDGWTAARALKADQQTRAIPIVALTAHAMAGDREKALQAGCDDYHPKPIDFARLLEQIDALLEKKAAAPAAPAAP